MATFTHAPCAVLPKFKGNNGTPKLSFFPAELWEDQYGGQPGMWRVAQGDTYVTRPGESVSFFTLEGITNFIREHLADALAVPAEPVGILPDIPAGTAVAYQPHSQPYTSPVHTYTSTTPFVDKHGEWLVWVRYVSKPVLLADLQPRFDHRREQHAK